MKLLALFSLIAVASISTSTHLTIGSFHIVKVSPKLAYLTWLKLIVLQYDIILLTSDDVNLNLSELAMKSLTGLPYRVTKSQMNPSTAFVHNAKTVLPQQCSQFIHKQVVISALVCSYSAKEDWPNRSFILVGVSLNSISNQNKWNILYLDLIRIFLMWSRQFPIALVGGLNPGQTISIYKHFLVEDGYTDFYMNTVTRNDPSTDLAPADLIVLYGSMKAALLHDSSVIDVQSSSKHAMLVTRSPIRAVINTQALHEKFSTKTLLNPSHFHRFYRQWILTDDTAALYLRAGAVDVKNSNEMEQIEDRQSKDWLRYGEFSTPYVPQRLVNGVPKQC